METHSRLLVELTRTRSPSVHAFEKIATVEKTPNTTQQQDGQQSATLAQIRYVNGSVKDEQAVAEVELSSLPPPDLVYALVELYFEHIHTWCPILDRPTMLNMVMRFPAIDQNDRILLHAIVATTLRFSRDPRLDEQTRQRYHEDSKQRVLVYGLENSSIGGLQALVILALDYIGSSHGGPGLKLLAAITRSAVQLGLATETTSASINPDYPSISTLRTTILPDPENWIEDESRRRLFWMVYILDRDTTVATAFEFALDESDIDRKLPCHDDYFSTNQAVQTRHFGTYGSRTSNSKGQSEVLGTFSYLVEVKGLLSRIHKFLKRPVDISALSDIEKWQHSYRELDNTLRAWHRSLPDSYANMARVCQPSEVDQTEAVSSGWMLLQAAYFTSGIPSIRL